jgi:ElaA protein
MKFSTDHELKIVNFGQVPIALWQDAMRLRSEIFVLDQQCIYSDPDDLDKESTHAFITIKKELIAYARYYQKDGNGHIGRVITAPEYRGKGLGQLVINKLILHHEQHCSGQLFISAQVYLYDYYAKLGFQVKGNMYLEDGIPHLSMSLKKNVQLDV